MRPARPMSRRQVWVIRLVVGGLVLFLLGFIATVMGLLGSQPAVTEIAVVLFVGGLVLILLAVYAARRGPARRGG